MVHGSPRQVNEFLWDTTSPDDFLERLVVDARADVLLCTHTGIPWQRELPSGRRVVNVGALARPANDGRTEVWYSFYDSERAEPFEFIPVAYDHRLLAGQMQSRKLQEGFVGTIFTGCWTTSLDIL